MASEQLKTNNMKQNDTKTDSLDIDHSTGYVNKDGTVKKVYARKLWNYVVETSCDSYNGELEDGELEHRIKGFRRMLNELLPHNSRITHRSQSD